MAKKSISDEDIFEELTVRKRRGEPCALAILVETEGSVPAKAGCKMLVTSEGDVIGTIGGGGMEKEAVDKALVLMKKGGAETLHVDLSKGPDYVCGGRATIYIEPICAPPQLIIAGAGHVGQALCHCAAFAGFSVVVIDDRPEFADPDILPEASQVLVLNFRDMFSRLKLNPGSFVVCATRGHAHDYEVIRQALTTSACYVGLVGSLKKRAGFLQRLRKEDGMSEEDLARLFTPVGLNIGAVSPQEIAVSIVAELIRIRRKHEDTDGFDSARRWGVPSDGMLQTAPAD